VELASPDEHLGRIDIRSDSPERYQRGYIVSTRILGSKTWTEFGGGELIAFKRGEIVHPRERATV
jgi:hypothetical protein